MDKRKYSTLPNALMEKCVKNDGYLGEYVFQNDKGRVHAKTISDCTRRRFVLAGIEPKSIHALRRTLNSKLRCEGVSAVVAASSLGHSEEVNDNCYTYDTTGMEYKVSIPEPFEPPVRSLRATIPAVGSQPKLMISSYHII